MNERAMTVVFIAPKRNRNSLWSWMSVTCLLIIAAWDAPSPGRNAVNGAAIIEANDALARDVLLNLIFFI